MTISAAARRTVRLRASHACEYCGVSEAETGGELTIDHYQPRAHGGDDNVNNLVYSCFRCNQYKAGYWPTDARDESLWNPRRNRKSAHIVDLSDGILAPLTASGAFTVRRLRLNRPALVAYRRRNREQSEAQRLIEQYQETVAVLEQLHQYQLHLLDEQRLLLDEQHALLRILLSRAEPPRS